MSCATTMLLKSVLLCAIFSIGFTAVVRQHVVHKPSYASSRVDTGKGSKPAPSCQCPRTTGRQGWGDGRGSDVFWRIGGTQLSRMMDGRLDGQASFLDNLQREFKAIETTVKDKHRATASRALRVRELELRIDKLEGTGCPADSFQCGGDFRHCINILLVCDGLKDCDTGRDEDEDLCRTLTPAGTTLVGSVVGPDDCTNRKPQSIRIVITHVATPHSWYVAHKHVKGVATLKSHHGPKERTDTLLLEGQYQFAKRRLVIDPPDDDNLNLVCEFDGIHDHRCVASIRNVDTGEVCLQFLMTVTGQ